MMRVFWAVAVLLGCVLIPYAATGTAAQGQATQAGLTSGERVRLYFDAVAAGTNCTVVEVRGDFVGCRSETESVARASHDSWYNLRLIERIDRPVKE